MLDFEVFPTTWADFANKESFERFAVRVATALCRRGRKNAVRRMRQLMKDPGFVAKQARLKTIFLGH